ncbi:hypothetical protein FNV43_RR00469 [Rhamnella rubrinervis]|uniref:Uncharacterized protein n=1 Tax=Rhamnella rubrinervis TaxID=2594499 RepID=A0A8K0MRF4_9ROSA|nr:hypothetical protein FNV43_RR00469 [Rhamnella rubrinervis]
MANKNAELQRLTSIYKNILKNANVTLIEVGGLPFIPEIPGREYAIDSDAALDLPSKPEKIAIVGGGLEILLRNRYLLEELSSTLKNPPKLSLSLKTNKGTVEGFSHILFATGRRPNTKLALMVVLDDRPSAGFMDFKTKNIIMIGIPNFVKYLAAIIMRIREPKTMALIFASEKMM